MKKIKIVIGIFALSCILSLTNVKASSFFGFNSITVPGMQGTYTTKDSVEKTTYSDQYVRKAGATDKLSGDDRNVGAKLTDVTTYYVETVKDKYVKLFNNNSGLGSIPGNYKLTLRAGTWTVSSIYFSGTWVLDDYLIN